MKFSPLAKSGQEHNSWLYLITCSFFQYLSNANSSFAILSGFNLSLIDWQNVGVDLTNFPRSRDHCVDYLNDSGLNQLVCAISRHNTTECNLDIILEP